MLPSGEINLKCTLAIATVLLIPAAWPQTPAAAPNTAPAPKVLLLVYQQFLPGKSGARQALERDIAGSFDRLAAPISWIELESLTGPPQALFIDPANSFAEIDKAGTVLAQIYGMHPDLAQSQQQIEDVVANSRTVTAVLRDDLSLNAHALSLSKARYLSLRVIQVRPERLSDFIKALQDHWLTFQTRTRFWVTYQVNAGLPDLTFLVIEPMHSMQDVDHGLLDSDLAPLAFASSSETNLYAIHPEMSHVSKEFAAGDPTFWMRTPVP
jgi:hypothetical protein